MESLKNRYARPDPKERKEPFDVERRWWARTLERRCPWCHEVFYTYQVVGEEQEPGLTEPERPLVSIYGVVGLLMPDGKRSTCGLDVCERKEESACLARHQGYQFFCSESRSQGSNHAVAVTTGGLRRMA